MLILFCMRGCGRIERPAFPAPSDVPGRTTAAKLARTRGESARLWLLTEIVGLHLQNTSVMPGLDPGIHQSSQEFFRRRWITGSSPVMTI
jgi:hypothetical protein